MSKDFNSTSQTISSCFNAVAVGARSRISSAYNNILKLTEWIAQPIVRLLTLRTKLSMYIAKKYGDKTPPWRTPQHNLKNAE
jgi:hypothetical protein